jgi:dipeptidyl-peptidase-3
MKLITKAFMAMALSGALMSCHSNTEKTEEKSSSTDSTSTKESFEVTADRFGEFQVLRYQVPGFDALSLQQKKLAYYLYQAALSGRDIIWDQKYRHNLQVRKMNEAIFGTFKGDKKTDNWKKFETYAKRVWFCNGIHQHYSSIKMLPEFNFDYLKELLNNCEQSKLPLEGQTIEQFTAAITPVIFDPNTDGKEVNLAKGIDNVKQSANNFYEGLTQKEVEDYYKKLINTKDTTPVMYGLNSKLTKENGKIVEKTYKVGGMYTQAIEKIVFWLQKATDVAENEQQKDALTKLIKFYQSGDLKDFDSYNIAWVQDVNSIIDNVNGFIEVYGDAVGMRGGYEAIVSLKDVEATKMIDKIAKEAQWFEDHSPIAAEHKKKTVKGITAKVINVAVETGDAGPYTPIGINLPNSNWIRQQHGSKSVSLGNIVKSYNEVGAKSPSINEFGFSQEIIDRIKKYGPLSSDLHTDMHEVIGHASGQINKGIETPDRTLKNYANTLEEARADLVGLYYIMDQKLVDMGIMPSLEVGKAQYDNYILNGMMLQLNRLNQGEDLEEAHMRNRQLIAAWVFDRGQQDKVIEKTTKEGKTYFHINDYNKLRGLFGQLLKEIQRIKSEGDFKSATTLVETYGVKADQALLKEVKERFAKLNIAPYKGFIQPKLVPVMEGNDIKDVKLEYPKNFAEQMMEYGREYSFLPVKN